MRFKKCLIWLLAIIIAYLAGCVSKPVVENEINAVAVWDLENLNPDGTAGADLGELLSAKIIETLKVSGNFEIVERERLLIVLEELNLSTTSLVYEPTRLKIGKILGARFMIFGSYLVMGDKMRLDLRMVEVETGRIHKATQKTVAANDLAGWLEIAQKAAQELI